MAYKTTSKQSVANTGVTASSNITTSPPPVISQVYYTDSAYNVITATAAGTTTGGYLKLVGTGFQYGATVYLNGLATTVLSTTVVSSTEIRVRIAALTAATYSLMLFNPNNTGAIYANGIVYSAEPAWTTTSYSNTFDSNVLSIQLVVTGDAPLTYSLQSGSALPVGVTLSSTGLISGTASEITRATIVTFTVVVSDLQNQTTPQLITLTMTFYISYLWAWGQNTQGQLGDSSAGTARSSPIQVGALDTWLNIASGVQHTVAVKSNGTLWAWGDNFNGQLGDNTTILKRSPVQVGALTNWSAVAVAIAHTIATKTDGTLWTWGRNVDGQLGLGNTTGGYFSPKQVGALTNWLKVSSGGYYCVATKTDGTLWAWGNNYAGKLGLGATVSRSSPTQVGALTNWSTIAAGTQHTIAIKTDGTLWDWGNNNFGHLGDGTTIKRSSPVQIGVSTDWLTIAAGGYHSAATKTNSTLWAWGYGNKGQLGQGTTLSRSSPVQVGTLTSWLNISAGLYHTIATKTDSTLWSWGMNNDGQLGQGDTISRSSPVQVGLRTNWIKISVGRYYTIAITT